MSEFLEQFPRRIFLLSVAITICGAAFLSGAYAQRKNLPPIPQIKAVYKSLSTTVGSPISPRAHHLQPTRGQGSGVTVNLPVDDGALISMAGFFEEENQMRLIKRDGTLVRKWSLDYFKHFPDADSRACDLASPLHTDIHGAHITPSGELVFNYEYCGTVKLDQCGDVIWRLGEPSHHSLVPAESGGYWILGRQEWPARSAPDRFPPFSAAPQSKIIQEDTLLRVSENGEILEEVSIPKLMRDNNLEAVWTASVLDIRFYDTRLTELMHANKVAELPSGIADAYPLFAAGDLAISMRGLNLIIVVDPVSKKVKWHQTGPWLRQHDPEFRPDGKISIFNNNVYRTAYVDERTDLSTPFSSNIMVVDPVTRETQVVFGQSPGQEMLSVIRGQHELLGNGGMIITEFDGGRVIEIDASGQIVWEYVNKYDDEFIGEVTNAASYAADYFSGAWRTCGM
jgi:hypothetical protein